MNNKTVLITGACGFIGHNVCLKLIENAYDVICLDIRKAEFVDQLGLKFIQSDLQDLRVISEKAYDIDAIVHLASTVTLESSNENVLNDVKSNLENAIKLMDFAVTADIKKFVFMSSGGTVYGNPTEVPIPETHATEPICSYGITKLAIEKYMRLYHQLHGLETCAIRLANPYGRFQNPNAKQGLIPIFCRKALNDEEITIFGDGSIERDFIYVDDLSDAMLKILEYDGQLDEINIGSGTSASINKILCTISTELDKNLNIKYQHGRAFDVKKNLLSIKRAEEVLNWKPQVSLQQGIEKTLKFMINELKKDNN